MKFIFTTDRIFLRILLIAILSVFILVNSLLAQMLGSDQPPPDIHWRQIETQHYRIIFPAEIESESQRMANTLEYVYLPLRKTLKANSPKWPLVLSNRSAVANGYVTLAPRKSEWFTTPDQSAMSGNIEWYNLLATHEGRHMVQFDRFNSGFTRLAGFLFGEYAILGLSFWHAPMWFWEGDAVAMETALTESGRGCQPEFDLPIRTLLINQKLYSYDKAYLGSYKDYYPNYYHLGFLMVTHGRRQYGANIWDHVLTSSTRRSWNPFGFSKACRINTGRKTKELYYDTMTELDSLWHKQIEGLEITSAKKVNLKPKKVWTQYRWPQYANDGSIIAVINGLGDINTLVKINPDGQETEIAKIASANRFSTAGNLIAWEELTPHPRWGAAIFSDIVVYDLLVGQERKLTKNGKYFSPAVAPHGQMIAAVKFTPERKCNLVLLDSNDGQEIRTLSNPDNGFIKNPAWSPDGKQLVYFKQSGSSKSLAIYDLENNTEEIIIAECHSFDEYPVFYGDYLLYNSAWSGIDNIYAVEIDSGRRFQVTSRKYGAYYPAVSADGSMMLFSDYDFNGLDICAMHLEPARWQALEAVERCDIRYYETLVAQEQGGNIFEAGKIPTKSYPVTDYDPYRHLFNFHSWYYFFSETSANLGLFSNDILNTTAANFALNFDVNEKAFSFGSEVCYAGFYPILSAGFNLGKRISYSGGLFDELTTETWNETSFSLGANLPLDYSSSVFNRKLNLGLSGAYTYISDKTTVEDYQIGNGGFVPFSYEIAYQNYQTPAIRDVKPTAGYTVKANFKHTPLGGDYQSQMYSFQGNYYLPGLAKHHSLMLNAKVELQNPDNYRFASLVPFAKGYDYIYNDRLAGAGATYELPLAYPDWALGSLFYLKRLRGAFFGDFNVGKTSDFKQQYNSVGLDLNFDFNLLQLAVELNAGVRLAYRLAEKDLHASLLIFNIEF